ncbi:MAG: orotidine-5'-phosphate decarboxylase, partial [Alphaproteobacteria bacterium]
TVVASSNPEGRALQQARTEDGITISEVLVNAIARRNASGNAAGVCGAVIGATRDDVGRALMERLGSALILVPGLGAQGADYGALAKFPCPRTVIPTAARAVLSTAGDEATFRGTLARQCNDSMRLRD